MLGIVLATIIGFIIGIARLSQNWLIAQIATVYVETFRNIPLLLQSSSGTSAVLSVLPGRARASNCRSASISTIAACITPAPIFERRRSRAP